MANGNWWDKYKTGGTAVAPKEEDEPVTRPREDVAIQKREEAAPEENWWDKYKSKPQGAPESAAVEEKPKVKLPVEGAKPTEGEAKQSEGNWWDKYKQPSPKAAEPPKDPEKALISDWEKTTQNYDNTIKGYNDLRARYEELGQLESRTPEQEQELSKTWNDLVRSGLTAQSDVQKVQELQPQIEQLNERQRQNRINYIESRRGTAMFGDEAVNALYELDAKSDEELNQARQIEDPDQRKKAIADIQTRYQAEEKNLLSGYVDRFKEKENKITSAAEVIGKAVASGQTVDQYLLETEASVPEYDELRNSLINQDDPEKGKLYRDAMSLHELAQGTKKAAVVNGEVRVSPLAVWDSEAVKKEIESFDVSDAQKQQIANNIPQMQEEAAKVEYPFLQKINEFNDFVKDNDLLDAPPTEQIAAWKGRTPNWTEYVTKAPAQVGLGLAQGALGLLEAGQAIVGATAMTMGATDFADPVLDSAAQTSDKIQELNRISKEIGGPTFLGELAAVVPQIAAQIGVGGVTGLGARNLNFKPKTVSNIGFASSVGTAMAQSYGGVLSSSIQQLEKEKIDGGMDPARARAEAVKESQLPAALSGLSTGVITAIGGKRGVEAPFRGNLDDIKAKLTSSAFRAELPKFIPEVVKGMRNEGYEEFADQMAQGIIEQFTFNPDLSTGDLVNNAFKALLIGGITGGSVEGIKYGFDYMKAPSEMARRKASMTSIRESISNIERDIAESSASSPIGSAIIREYDATLPSDFAATLGGRAVDRERMNQLQAEREQISSLLEDENISRVARNDLESRLAVADYNYHNEILLQSRQNILTEQVVDELDAKDISAASKEAITGMTKIANGMGLDSLTGRERVALGVTKVGDNRYLPSKQNPMVDIDEQGNAAVNNTGKRVAETTGMVPLSRMIGFSEQLKAKQEEAAKVQATVLEEQAKQEAKNLAESEDAKRYGPATADALKQQVESLPPSPEGGIDQRVAQLLREEEAAKTKAEEAFNLEIESRFVQSFRKNLSKALVPTETNPASMELDAFRKYIDSIAPQIANNTFNIDMLEQGEFKTLLPADAYTVVVEAFKENPRRALNALRSFADEAENAIKEFGGGGGGMEEPPEVTSLRRVVKAEQTPEDVAALTERGFVELYKDQPVLTQAGIDVLPETERPRLTPEARKIQIDTGASDVVAEAISKNLRIGIDQVPPAFKMPEGWTLEGDIYIPPQKQEVVKAEEPKVVKPKQPKAVVSEAEEITTETADNIVEAARKERARQPERVIGRSKRGPMSLPPRNLIGKSVRDALKYASRVNLSKIAKSNPNEILMQDVAAILAELKIPILDTEQIVSLASKKKRGRPRRWVGGPLGVSSSIPSPVEDLIHEVGHTLTMDQINRYSPRKSGKSGKEYLDAINKIIESPKTPEPISRLFSLYVSTIDQLGFTDQYFGDNGIANSGNADFVVAKAQKLQQKGSLPKDLIYERLYGLSNIEEFVSQTFSEPSFRNMLKSLKDPTNARRSLWQAFVDAIQSILNLPKGSMAAAVIEASVDVAMVVPPVKGGAAVSPAPEQAYPSIGININDSGQNFTEQILAGDKTIETRDSDSLRPYVGKRVGIVRTGVGPAMLVGYATIGEPKVYNTAKEFRADENKHLVAKGSDFDIKTGGIKYGYPLTDIEEVSPTPVTDRGWIVARRIPQPEAEVSAAPEAEKVVEMSLEMEKERTFQLLGERLYTADLPKVVVKETTQNAFDAIKDAEETGEIPRGSGVITYSRKELEVNGEKIVRMMFADNGGGMTPEILQNAFFTVGGTFKRSGKGSGGFGLAKLGMFMSADRVMVETVRDGVVTSADLSKQELVDKKFNVNIAEDPNRKNGTMVILEFKKSITRSDGKTVSFEDPYTQFDKLIHHNLSIIDDGYGTYQNELIDLFQNKPNILYTFDEIKDLKGKTPYTFEDFVKDVPNVETYEQEFTIAGAKKPIKVRVAAARLGLKNKDGKAKWNENIEIAGASRNLKNHSMSVYSNGLFQFEQENLRIDPTKLWGGDPLPYNILVDIDAGGVDAASLAYPFTNSREGFQKGVVNDYINTLLNEIRVKERQRQFDQEFNLLTDISGGKPRKDSPTLYNNTTIVPQPFEQKFLEDLSRAVFDVADDLVVALRKGNEDNILEDTWYKVKSQKGSVAPTGRAEEDTLDYFYGVGISKNWGGVNTSRDPVSVLVNPIYEERVDEYARTEFGRRILARTIAKTLIHEINHHLHRNEGSDFTFFILQNEAYLGEVGAIQSAVDKILPIVNQHPDAIISLKNKFRTAETKDTDNELTGEQYERSSKEPDGQPRTVVVGGDRLVQQPSAEVSPRPTSEEDGEQTGAYLPSSLTVRGRKDASIGEGIPFGEVVTGQIRRGELEPSGAPEAATVTPSKEATIDAQHADAMARGAKNTAQRLSDKAAKQSKYQSHNLLFHGTTHIFNVFRKDRANIENDFGKGYYLTNTESDAQTNYAGEGPDLTNRIERLSEQLQANEDMDENVARKKAQEILSGGGKRIMRVYVKLENPFNVGGPNETFLDYELPYDEATEEYGEATGRLVDFMEALRPIIESYSENSPVDANKAIGKIQEYAIDNGGIKASELVKLLKEEDSGIMWASDENGDLASGEIIRQAIEDSGFDGIVDHLVNQKFGKNKYGGGMKGMGPDTIHTIVFSSNQIKSADAATYDDQGNLIPLSQRFKEDQEDIRFAAEEGITITADGSVPPADGTPEATTSRVMADAMRIGDEQSAKLGTSEGTFPLETITNAWLNSGLGQAALENAIIRYTNLSDQTAVNFAEAFARQYEIQKGLNEIYGARKKEVKERAGTYSFADRVIEAGELPAEVSDKISRVYQVLRNDVSAEEANNALRNLSLDEAINAVKDLTNGISFPVRSMMAQIVERRILDYRKNTKAKGAARDYSAAVDAHVDFFNWISDYSKEMGQGIQAFAQWINLGPDGIVRKLRRDTSRIVDENIKSRKKKIDKIKKDVEDGDNKSFDEAMARNKKRIEDASIKAGKEEAKKVTIEQEAQKIAQRLAQRIERETKPKKTDPLSDLVNGHIRKINPDFVQQAIALGVSPETANQIDEAAKKLEADRKAIKDQREAFRKAQETRARVSRQLARENKYIYGERPTIWEDYQTTFAERFARALLKDGKKTVPPSLMLFTNRLTQNLIGFIPETQRQTATPQSFQAFIEDALNNKDRYREAFNRAMVEVSTKIAELETEASETEAGNEAYFQALAAQDFMKKLAPEIKDFPVSEKTIMRFVNQKSKALQISLPAAYNSWYRADRKTRKEIEARITQQLVADVNVDILDAQRLAKAISNDFKQKAEERRKKALERFKAPKEKIKPDRAARTDKLQRFLELVNMGTLSDREAYEILAERFQLPVYDEDFVAYVYETAQRVQEMDDGLARRLKTQELMSEIARNRGFDPADIGAGFVYANILSSPDTHMVNILDTAINNFANGLADAIATRDLSRLRGIIRGYRKGIFEAAEVMKTGKRINVPGFEEKAPLILELLTFGESGGVKLASLEGANAIVRAILESKPSKVLNAAKYIGRLLEAQDALNFAASVEGERYARASRMAAEEGLKGDAARKHMNELLNLDDTAYQAALKQAETEGYTGAEAKFRAMEIQDEKIPQEIKEASFERGLRDVYRNMPVGVAGLMSDKLTNTLMAIQNPLARNVARLTVSPFVITPINLFNKWLDWSPWGYKRMFFGTGNWAGGKYYVEPFEKGSAERRAQMLKASSGIFVMTIMYGLVRAGLATIHGRGPSDEEERKQWLDDGNKPYTIQFGNGPALSFAYTPWALMLSWMANVENYYKYNAKEEPDEQSALWRMAAAAALVPTILEELPFYQGVDDIYKTLKSASQRDFEKAYTDFFEPKVAMLFPNFLRYVDRLFDPKVYNTEGAKALLIDQIPFVRRLGGPRLNMFGEPIGEGKKFYEQLATRFVSFPKPSRESSILAKYDAYPFIPSPKEAKALTDGEPTQMTPEQYEKFIRGFGKDFKEYLNETFDPDVQLTPEEIEADRKALFRRVKQIREQWVREVSDY